MTKPIKAWWFGETRTGLRYGDERQAEPGTTLEHKGGLILCESGLHASTNIMDALAYAPGPWIHRVELSGEMIQGSDKIVAQRRKHLWVIDGEEVLRRFARKCAQDVLHLWDAPEVVTEYLKTGNEELRAAARAAAWAAAQASAQASARAADSAWAAAWDVARAKQSRRLASMVHAERRRQ